MKEKDWEEKENWGEEDENYPREWETGYFGYISYIMRRITQKKEDKNEG